MLPGSAAAEFPVFVRVLRALPKEGLGYRPHERSPSAAQIVWTLNSELRSSSEIIDTGRIDRKPTPPKSLDER